MYIFTLTWKKRKKYQQQAEIKIIDIVTIRSGYYYINADSIVRYELSLRLSLWSLNYLN